jgi:hypothetical protein
MTVHQLLGAADSAELSSWLALFEAERLERAGDGKQRR